MKLGRLQILSQSEQFPDCISLSNQLSQFHSRRSSVSGFRPCPWLSQSVTHEYSSLLIGWHHDKGALPHLIGTWPCLLWLADAECGDRVPCVYSIINFQYKLCQANLLLLWQNWGEKTAGILNRTKYFVRKKITKIFLLEERELNIVTVSDLQ